MLKSFIFIFAIFISISVQAKIDFKNCKEFIDRTNSNSEITTFRFPFEVNNDGEIVYELPAYDKKDLDENLREYRVKDQNGNTHIFKVSKEDNQIDQITYLIDFAEVPPAAKQYMSANDYNQLPVESYTTIQFDKINGHCVPAWSDISSATLVNDLDSYSFDTYLCRDIQEFFENNENQKACFDIDSEQNQEMNELFKVAGFNPDDIVQSHWFQTPQNTHYTNSIEQRIITSHPNVVRTPTSFSADRKKQFIQLIGSSPLQAAHRILMDCYEKGLQGTLNNSSIWEEQVDATPELQSETTTDAE